MLGACAATPPPRPVDPALLATAALAEVRADGGGEARCAATGGAVHLGQGRFLTAAHIVDGSTQRLRGACPPGPPRVALSVRGATQPARLLRAGRDRVEARFGQRYLDAEDLAILAPAASLPAQGAATICAAPPVPGQQVLLATPRRSLRTRITRLALEPDPVFGSYVEIPETLAPGESGGALFDAATGCLAGLVSHREEDGGPPRTRLVPAAVIRRFVSLAPGP